MEHPQYVEVPEGFEYFMEAWDNDNLPDGAWWAMLEEGVASYNAVNGTHIDPNDGVHEYLRLKSNDGSDEAQERILESKGIAT